MKQNYEFVTLDSEMGACCTSKVDAGISSIWNRFHLYFLEKDWDMRTLCGINLEYALDMIDQGKQGTLRDAKVSCKRCDKVLQSLKIRLQSKGSDIK